MCTVYVCVCLYVRVCPCVCFLQWHEHLIELRMARPQLCENLIAFISQTAWPSQCLTLDMHYTWSLTWPDPSAPSLWYILSLRSPEPCNLRPADTRLVSATGDQGWNYTLSPCLQNTKEYSKAHTDYGHFMFFSFATALWCCFKRLSFITLVLFAVTWIKFCSKSSCSLCSLCSYHDVL